MYTGNAKNVHVGAVCDTFTGHLARGKDRVQTMEGSSPKTFNDYREIPRRPIYRHCVHHDAGAPALSMMMAALKAGKNIYVEKPLATPSSREPSW